MEVCLAARASGMVISEAALRGNLVGAQSSDLFFFSLIYFSVFATQPRPVGG